MTEFTTEIVIDRPLAEVRAALRDPELAPRWMDGLQRVEAVAGAAFAAGAAFRYHFDQGGMEFALERSTAELDDDRHRSTFKSPFMDTEVEETLEPLGTSTRLISRNVLTSHGPPLDEAMVGGIRARQEADFGRLKALLEGR